MGTQEFSVITYQAPSHFGAKVDLTQPQIERLTSAGAWPRNSSGEQLCIVSHGLHLGAPTYTDEQINAIISDQS